MVIASLEIFPERFENTVDNQRISAFELLELSKSVRGHVRRVYEACRCLEDNSVRLLLNKFSVDAEIPVDTVSQANEYLGKLGLDPAIFDFIEVLVD